MPAKNIHVMVSWLKIPGEKQQQQQQKQFISTTINN